MTNDVVWRRDELMLFADSVDTGDLRKQKHGLHAVNQDDTPYRNGHWNSYLYTYTHKHTHRLGEPHF